MKKKSILVIVGPTASGKSDLAVRLAKSFNGEVISADSRQVYKGLNIGTGKITKKEMRGVKHHLLDVASPKKQFSASEFKKLGEKALQDIYKRNKLPIIVGGTGFYIDALLGHTALPEVPPNRALRARLDRLHAEILYQLLLKVDPRRAEAIDRHNRVRLVRALEIVEALGRVPVLTPSVNEYETVWIGLMPKDLDKRIYKRLVARVPGMIREAKKLRKLGLTYKRMHELGLEYRYLSLYLQGKLSKIEMVEKLNIEIRHYAKRQMTWFKRNKKIKWFEPSKFKEIEKYARIAVIKGD